MQQREADKIARGRWKNFISRLFAPDPAARSPETAGAPPSLHIGDGLLRDAIDSIAEGFVIHDADDRFVMCNEAYRRLYHENAGAFQPGARYEDIMRTALATGRYPEAVGREEEWLAAWMRKHHQSEATAESRLKDGRWVLVSERRMPNGGIVGLRIDITVLKAIQASLRESEYSLRLAKEEAETAKQAVQAANETLERRVEERTKELEAAQEKLLQSERLSVLGKLTATVAHELRNPLSAIRNTCYALREAAGPDALQFARPLARIERSVARCEDLVADLLNFTRPKEPNKKPLKLDEWLGEVLDEMKIADGMVLERRFGAAGAIAALDADQFRRVIINLIENAAQAMSSDVAARDQRRIAVTTALSDGVEIIVEDSGPGIPADVLPKVFDPLFSTKSFGTGLGLPTVKQIVEQHGGTVSIVSEPGCGAAVHIRMPASQALVAVA